jgi:hypothetical protein
MTNNRHPIPSARTPKSSLHERYVRAVNSAVQDGNDNVAAELAATYDEDTRHHEANRQVRKAA